MINRKRSSSSKRWLKRHFNDQYVKNSRKMRVRSRAWFKLDQINSTDFLFYPGMRVVDLGSAPGGWSEYVKKKIGAYGYIIACDILPMKSIVGVDFLQGDFSRFDVLERLLKKINGRRVDIVLSDMSKNTTGIVCIDVCGSVYLCELVLDICQYILVPGGSLLVKIFQGEGFDKYCRSVHALFHTVRIRKPIASRVHSREVYIVAKGYDI